MPQFTAVIDVKKSYAVNIEAGSQAEAEKKADAMQSSTIQEEGSLKCVETEVMDVTPADED